MEEKPKYMLLVHAEGTIGAKEHQQERLDEMTERVSSSEFHVPIPDTVPYGCIDGRCGCSLKPNAAGGTNTIAAAFDLLNDTSTDYLESYRHIVALLKDQELPIGGHDDEHASDSKSGCGACDRMKEIYDFMARNAEVLRGLEASLGFPISNATHKKMVDNAAVRQQFATGPEIKAENEANDGTTDHLRGSHNEVVAVINMRPETTLDRDALEAEFGPDYEAFNVDAWSFENAAKAIVGDDLEKVRNMVVAMVRYNLATAHVLCDKNMRVAIVE